MRTVRYSATFIKQSNTLLAQVEPKFGARVIDEKRDLVYDAIDHHIAMHPRKVVDPETRLHAYPVAKTPFVVLYEFDDSEVRVFYIIHGRSDRTRIDPTDVEW